MLDEGCLMQLLLDKYGSKVMSKENLKNTAADSINRLDIDMNPTNNIENMKEPGRSWPQSW